MTARRLGRLPVRHDPRTLRLASYLRPTLPPPPEAIDYGDVVRSWPMYANDRLGDCTCAAAAHQIQAWTAEGRGHEARVSEAAVVHAYQAVGGYVPGDPSTDQGAVELDVLRYWRATGIGGHRIGAYAAVHANDEATVRTALWLFGGLYTGISLPASAETQDTWDVALDAPEADQAPGSWGGHAVPVVAYDPAGLTCITWGAAKRLTWAFFARYCEEAYALLSADFLLRGVAPHGFDVHALQADLAAVSR